MKQLAFPLALLLLTSLACSIQFQADTSPDLIPEQTFSVAEVLSEPTEVLLRVSGGTLYLAAGGDGLEGTVRYNVAALEPKLSRDGNRLRLTQAGLQNMGSGVVNDWDIRLTDAVPLDLSLMVGAYRGVLDLSGLPLQRLTIQAGAEQGMVIFDQPNPLPMGSLEYTGGASQARFRGLGNANAAKMTFSAGVGDYLFDFSGEWQRDAEVWINAGVSQVTVQVPVGVPATVEIGGGLRAVSASGAWSGGGSRYTHPGDGPGLTIHVDMGLGNLVLREP